MEQNLDEQPQRVSLWSRIVKLPPAIKIAGSFVILILLGALLLAGAVGNLIDRALLCRSRPARRHMI